MYLGVTMSSPQITIEKYSASLHSELDANGFFEGWLTSPGPDGLHQILRGSYRAFIALDTRTRSIVGFINCISDGVLTCFIPLLEVVPTYRKKGIARILVERMIEETKDFYMVDLICDEELMPFYDKFNFKRSNAMVRRNYKWQLAR